MNRLLTVAITVITLLGGFAVTPALAQPADTVSSLPGVELQTSVDKSEISVGDRIKYTLTIIHDTTIQLEPPPLGANLGNFQVLDYNTDQITKLPDGREKSTNDFIISTFTTGEYTIPPMPIVFIMPDSTHRVLLSEPIPITVKSLLTAGDTSMIDIKPIAAPYEFKRDYTKYYIGGAAALLILGGLLFWWLRRKKVEPDAEPVDPRPAWEIAFERLAILQEKRLVEDGFFKQYYYELSETLRWYLGRMYVRRVMDMTTEEFLEEFAGVNLPDSLYEGVSAFMSHADLVKFAKYEPEREQTGYDFDFVHGAIERVRSDFQRRTEVQTVTVSNGTDNGDGMAGHDEPSVPAGGGQS